jgi:4-aminobutyrate aminotransferase-like enzyme
MPEALGHELFNIMDSNSYTADGAGDPLITRRERVLGPAYRLFYDQPVHLVRGEGSHLFDADGVRYLDALQQRGERWTLPPAVVDAVSRQMATLNTLTRYLHRGIVDYRCDCWPPCQPKWTR